MKDGAGISDQETIRSETPIAGPPPSFVLVVVGHAGVRVVPLGKSAVLDVGRGEGSHVRIADPRMSRRHIRLAVTEEGHFEVEDLGSANGVWVNGIRLETGARRALAPGDPIEIGETMLVVRHYSTEPLRAPRSYAPALDEQMRAALELADRAALSNIAVLLLGETGVGKDVIADRIHRASPRAQQRFLRLSCAALAPSLLESELFGHEKGAFTGATKAKVGLLESAFGGTVFLDEIGDLSLDLQVKLLVVLERHEVMPVGAVRPRPIDVRILAATNRPLSEDVGRGAFRADLYYRLNGVTIEIPPLRERVSEIAGFARHFAREAARTVGRSEPEIAPGALSMLEAHSWPGNVRELRTVMERAVFLGDADVIDTPDVRIQHSPASVRSLAATSSGTIQIGTDPERAAVIEALAKTGGNQSRAAALLGMSRNTLIARIEKYGLARPLAVSRRST